MLRCWVAIREPEERLETALREIYAYFRSTEGMTALVLRDLPERRGDPGRCGADAPLLGEVRALLDRGWTARGRRRALLRATIGHAIAFQTWRSLARHEGLDDQQAADLMVRLARAV